MVDCEFFIYAIEYKGDDVDQNDVSGDKNCRNHGLATFMNEKTPLLAGSVEHNGVEPMTSCMPCKRSSQLS